MAHRAETTTPVRTHEFDAAALRMMMDMGLGFGSAIGHWAGPRHLGENTNTRSGPW
ncbi:hypothetical protein ACWCXE_20210 [Streptomyces sp. NPDC001780]